MADSGMFGAPNGVRAWEADNLEATQAGVKMAEAMGRIAMQPDEARLGRAKADAAELAVEAEHAMGRIMKDMSAGKGSQAGGSMAARFETLARAASEAGLITKAQELAKTAALLSSRETTANAAQATQKLREVQTRMKELDYVSNLMGTVKDEASWNEANRLIEFQTGQESPYARVPYEPGFVRGLQEQTLTMKDRLAAENQRLTREATKAFRDRRIGQHDTLADLRRQSIEITRQREARLAKAGGGSKVTAPSKEGIAQAGRILSKDYPDLTTADLAEAKTAIASDAAARMRANPALNLDAAIREAANAAKADFETQQSYGRWGPKKTTFKGVGYSAARPAPITPDTTPVKNRYYVNDAGKVAMWNGTGFVDSGSPIGGDIGNPNNDPDDDDEDDE